MLKPLPPDAILGIMTLFRADEDPGKIDLSVGVYQDENGHTPILDCVKRAERDVFEAQDSKTYVAIAGNPGASSAGSTTTTSRSGTAASSATTAAGADDAASGVRVAFHQIAPATPAPRITAAAMTPPRPVR